LLVATNMRRLLLDWLYAKCVRGARSWPRAMHRRAFQSPLVVRALFSITVQNPEPRVYLLDLSTVLLRGFLRARVRDRPEMKILEIGSGSFALPSGYLSRYVDPAIDAVDVDEGRVNSARRVARENGLRLKIFASDLFSSVPEGRYDLIFWNLPYYREPRFLHGLFEAAPRYMSEGAEVVLGYNTVALPRAEILGILAQHPRLRVALVKTWHWNKHEIMALRRDPAASRLGP
jgi:hypothetical protein